MNPYLRAAARLKLQALEKLQAREAEEPIIERARDAASGQYVGDDPTTPDVNEAWVEVKE